MKSLVAIFTFMIVAVAPAAFAKCPDTTGMSYKKAAESMFNCPSNRPLIGAEEYRKFRIHYDFPQKLPNAKNLPWLSIDPFSQPAQYMKVILDYTTKVNARPEIDWRIEDNRMENWCSAPWFQSLREPLHGLTSERSSRPRELHVLQTEWARTWAVGIYNDVACYGFGQIWKDPTFPKTKGFAFANGALSIKMLFTTAKPSQVPYLTGSKEWIVAANDDGSTTTMRLLQIDISTKDDRSPNGWFFGTFIYNATQPGDTVWDRMVPVGLIWGSDPDLTATGYYEEASVPKEGWMNPAVAAMFFPLPRQNLGLFGRVNGPVDNPKSACITCHQRAVDWGREVLRGSPEEEETTKLLPDVPFDPFDAAAAKKYFRNIGSDTPVPGTQSLDYSLQVSKGIAFFRTWVAAKYPEESANTTDVTPYPFKPSVAESADQLLAPVDALQNNIFER